MLSLISIPLTGISSDRWNIFFTICCSYVNLAFCTYVCNKQQQCSTMLDGPAMKPNQIQTFHITMYAILTFADGVQ